ncbi:MAG: flagellar export chaperone FliS [Bryobacteraceae bacterium]|jgi:flagellar protein FliS
MWQNARDAYLESRVLSADPLELVHLLYEAAIEAVREARRHLAAGEIAARSRSITKAFGILQELVAALDHDRGGEISARLAQLYDYMQRRLLEANFQQADGPLAEVLGLLATLAEAWQGVEREAQPTAPPENPWAQRPPAESAAAYGPSAWSF